MEQYKIDTCHFSKYIKIFYENIIEYCSFKLKKKTVKIQNIKRNKKIYIKLYKQTILN